MLTNNLLIRIPALLIAIILHELAHAWVATRLGDPTPKWEGRLTLNPLNHLDPIGLLLLWLVGFGWAKPVPINPANFNGNRDVGMAKVALAGPVMNVLIGIAATFSFYAAIRFYPNATLISFIQTLVIYTSVLAVFNLIPVPPLDGSRLLAAVLPAKYKAAYYSIERYGFLILILLVMTGLLDGILFPLTNGLIGLMDTIVFPAAKLIFGFN